MTNEKWAYVKVAIVVALFALVLCGNTVGQDKAGEPTASDPMVARHLHLDLVQTLNIQNEVAGMLAGPTRCDEEGNVYFMRDFDESSAIHKLSPKGEQMAQFRPSPINDTNIDVAGYFFVGPGGNVYQIILPHSYQRYVAAFAQDGTLESNIKLEAGRVFEPYQLAVFPSGEMLISGMKYDPNPDLHVKWPFTALFSPSGALIREISLKDDNDLHDMAVSGDKRVVSPVNPNNIIPIVRGAVEIASDGNAYLMRNLSPAIIYAVSPKGAVVRRFTVESKDERYRPWIMHVAGRKIAILFRNTETHDQFVKIVDLEGNEVDTYADSVVNGMSNLGLAFACYSANPERFTFLGVTSDNRLSLKVAQPR